MEKVKKDYEERVSVQIAAYRPQHLEDAILSVVNQDCDGWELVILIDGPPKNYMVKINKIVEKYVANPKIKVFVQENKGEGYTRKKLYKMTKHRYVLPLDDDDMLTKDAIREVLNYFKNNQGASMVRAGLQAVKDTYKYGDFLALRTSFKPRERIVKHGMTKNITYVDQLWCFNKELYDSGEEVTLYPEARYAGVEIELFLRLEELGPIVWIPKVLYIRREWAEQMTKNKLFPPNLTDYCIKVARETIKRRKLKVKLIWDVQFRVYQVNKKSEINVN